MLIEVLRDIEQPNYGTFIGKIYVDGVRACESLEGFGKETIPCGRYRVVINRCTKTGYDLPKFLSVPGFDDVRISCNRPAESDGWVLVGTGRNGGAYSGHLPGGETAFNELFQDIREVLGAGEQVWVTVG